MKSKIIHYLISVLAVVGIIVVLGAVGSSDYAVEIGTDLPLWSTVKMLLLGVSFMTPAFLREVM